MQETGAPQVGKNRLARDVPVQAAVFLRYVVVELGVERKDGDGRQTVTPADLPIIDVVCRCDLHGPGAECHIDVRVRDYRNSASGQRQRYLLADQASVSRG